ncbi:MAG: ArsR family transcriptional regulator [Thermoprotei archaeon]|nr:MAG: ArsR family transcriptional regulator [Thermoprotei archaeon]
MPEGDVWERLAEILSALAHPTRLKILALCSEKERSSRELREALGISKPLLLAHLRVLMRAGLIEYRAELDEQRFVVRKMYRAKSFRICISPQELRRLLDEHGTV